MIGSGSGYSEEKGYMNHSVMEVNDTLYTCAVRYQFVFPASSDSLANSGYALWNIALTDQRMLDYLQDCA